MISDLDRPEVSRPVTRWPLPVVTVLCVAAFIGVSGLGPAARDTARPASTLVVMTSPRAISAADTWQATRDLAPFRPVVAVPPSWQVREAQLERQSVSLLLGLPGTAYKSVARVANSVTTGLYPADEEALLQLRYRLLDDRTVVLVRLPSSDPLRGIEPSRYTVDTVIVRGIDARVLSGRTAIEPTILVWTESTRSYQLYSSALSGTELIEVAELLR